MEQYSLITRFVLQLKFFLVKTLKKYLPHYYFDRWIEPAYYGLKRFIYKVQFWLFFTMKAGSRKSVIFISGEWMTPGHYHRVERYVETYRDLGFPALWMKPDAVFTNIKIIDKCSLLIIWRTEMSDQLEKIIKRARKNNVRIIYDLDDLMFVPEMAKAELIDGIRSMGLKDEVIQKMYRNIRHAIEACDCFTCPTQYLAAEAEITGKPSFVLPNGYDSKTLANSVELYQNKPNSGDVIRIGYAGGTRTHQKDFRVALPALIKILEEFPEIIITLFGEALLMDEFEELRPFASRIEVRNLVNVRKLQEEIVRFDINIAPLETNAFCEAKSELKYFEAALLHIPTIASPTRPYMAAINHGHNGFLASDTNEWYNCLKLLVKSADLRRKMGHKAFNHVMWHFGPEQRINLLYEFLSKTDMINTIQITHKKQRKQALEMRNKIAGMGYELKPRLPVIPGYKIIKEYRKLKFSKAGVIIPLFNYENFVIEALESVKMQTLKGIDLVVVDDCSTDGSLQLVIDWMDSNHHLFNNCAVLQNITNSKLAATRNAAFDYSQAPYIMQLDADNQLLPNCLALCLKNIEHSGASVAYPQLEVFGADKKFILDTYYTHKLGFRPWLPERLAEGNYIDAMAMVSKAAWSKTGGYDTTFKTVGWEDYDMWLRFIEHGLFGICVPKVAARYRVHGNSMLREATGISYQQRREEIFERHPWVEKYEIKIIVQ